MEEETKNLVFAFLNQSPIINNNEQIDLNDLVSMAKFHKDKVKLLFDNRKSSLFQVAHRCFRCNKEVHIFKDNISILKFINAIRGNKKPQEAFKQTIGSGICQSCWDIIEKNKEEKEKAEKERIEEDKERIKEETYEFIFNYLNPRIKLDNGVKHFERLSLLREMKRKIDWEWVVDEAKDLAYKYYVKTPYWQIISTEVKKRADFKCQLCNHKGFDLNAHHSNYKILGYELDNLKELICLCTKCHKKHHGIGESE
ncbi:MAG: hypothetical protein WC055_01005 [Melioribacteraceae bacterium]